MKVYAMDLDKSSFTSRYKTNGKSKELLTEDVFVCLCILIESEIILNEIRPPSSDGAREIGICMADELLKLIDSLKNDEVEDLFLESIQIENDCGNNETQESLECTNRYITKIFNNNSKLNCKACINK